MSRCASVLLVLAGIACSDSVARPFGSGGLGGIGGHGGDRSGTGGAIGTGGNGSGGSAHDAGAPDGPPQQCPAFVVATTCDGGAVVAGANYSFCYICDAQGPGGRATDAAVYGCVNGTPGETGGACVTSCAGCAP